MKCIMAVAISLVAACSSGGSGNPSGGSMMSSSNPLCSSLCSNAADAKKVCSDQSVSTCAIGCDARVAQKSSPCQTCLLEKAYFGAGPRSAAFCDSETNQCEDSFGGKTCTWTQGDAAAEKACQDMLYAPKSYDGCDADYRPVTECASLCS